MTFQQSFTYWASFDLSSTAKHPLIVKAFFQSHVIEGPVSGFEEKKEEEKKPCARWDMNPQPFDQEASAVVRPLPLR